MNIINPYTNETSNLINPASVYKKYNEIKSKDLTLFNDNYSDKNILLISAAGCQRTEGGVKVEQLTQPYFRLTQGCGQTFYDIQRIVGSDGVDYLSIPLYRLQDTSRTNGSVYWSSFRPTGIKNSELGTFRVTPVRWNAAESSNNHKWLAMMPELRIYTTRKMALVVHVLSKLDIYEDVTLVFNSGKVNSIHDANGTMSRLCSCAMDWINVATINTADDVLNAFCHMYRWNFPVTQVTCDSEITKVAQCVPSNCGNYLDAIAGTWLNYHSSDVAHMEAHDHCCRSTTMSPEHNKIVKDFFHLTDTNSPLTASYSAKMRCNVDMDLWCLDFRALSTLLGVSLRAATNKITDKERTENRLMPLLKYLSSIRELPENVVTVWRSQTGIGFMFNYADHTGYYHSNGTTVIFIDTKTKTKKVYHWTGGNMCGNTVETTLNRLNNYVYASDLEHIRQYINYSSNVADHDLMQPYRIHILNEEGGIDTNTSLLDVLQNTIVAKICNEEFAGTEYIYKTYSYYNRDRDNEIFTKNFEYCNPTIYDIKLMVFLLIAQNQKLAEQLIASKMKNLLFGFLEDGGGISIFRTNAQNHSNAKCKGRINYDPKATNLVDAFGLTKAQLRILDDYCKTLVDRHDSSGRVMEKIREIPNLRVVREFIDNQPFNTLDIKMFGSLLTLSTTKADHYHASELARIARQLTTGRIKNIFGANYSDKNILAFLEKYKSACNYITDYWNMRERIFQYAQEHEDYVINEREYPKLPDKCTKFIPYEPMRMYGNQWSRRRKNPIEFLQWALREAYVNIGSFYGSTELRPWITTEKAILVGKDGVALSYDEFRYNQDQLAGVICKLSPADHLYYLHNQISERERLLGNAKFEAQFKQAAQVAQKYAYRDEKFGLSIVIPQKPDDLLNEGAVLSHCVGGYVQSVAEQNEYILFIRRNDMLEEPYFTMDILPNGEVRQIHCYHNGNPTEEGQIAAYRQTQRAVYDKTFDLFAFLKRWADNVGCVRKDSIQNTYRALCAVRR